MASKSKRRGRVFRASCILAALIIAGSSFAWFTSKDEVTNRLTATSDYGVSIVESFTPPKQWVPGQEVNKDVYAVNTGSVDAFVKESVSGKLSVEYEKAVNDFDTSAFTYVELSDDEVKLIKAGGFLAWNDAGATNGVILNNADPTAVDPNAGDWTPPAPGNYVFRRYVSTHDADNLNDLSGEKYTLEGFRYEGGKYYKILLVDDYWTGKMPSSRTAVNNVNADGTLAGAPQIKYVMKQTDSDKNVALYYKDGTDGKKYLVATYNLDPSASVNYDQNAIDARKAVREANAKGDLEIAQYEEDVAKLQMNLTNGLITKENTLIQAARDYKTAKADKDSKNQALTDVANAVANATADAVELQTVAPYLDRVLMSTDDHFTTATQDEHYKWPESVRTAITNFESKYNAIFNTATTGNPGYQKTLTDAFTALKTAVSDGNTDPQLDTAIQALRSAYTALDNASADLYAAYFDIVKTYADGQSTYPATTSSGLNISTNATTYKEKLGDAGVAGSYMEQVDNYKTKMEQLITKVEEFKTARTASIAADNEEGSKWTAFKNAASTYKNGVSGDIDAYYRDNSGTETGTLKNRYDNFAATLNQKDNGTTVYDAGKGIFLTNLKANPYYLSTYATSTVGDADSDKAAAVALATANTTDVAAVTEDNFKLHLDSSSTKTYKALKAETVNKQRTYDNIRNSTVTAPTATPVEILIELDKDYATNWTMNPAKADIDTVAEAKEKVDFYLNNILKAGETSAKLIESVKLDQTMQNVFKNLTFDLNVALDSAQITYADDNTTVKTDVVKNNANFTLKPSTDTLANVDTTITWQAPTT